MSLFDSLNRPKWQHKDPEVRRTAVGQLDDQDVLLDLVKTDADSTVQASALSRITSPDTLDTLIDTLPEALQQQARTQRLQQLLPDPDRLATISDDVILVKIAGLTDDPELLAAAIAQVGNDEHRLDIASNHTLAKVRLHAAQGIQDIELLDKLIHHARGHDKAVYRHCKTLLDEHHSTLRIEAERKEKILQLTQKTKELARAVDSPEYKGRYQLLERQWQTVKDWAEPAQKEQVQHDLAICSDRLSRLSDARAADEQRQTEQADAKQAFRLIIAELEQIDAATSAPNDLAAITQLAGVLDDIEKRWQSATEITPCSPEQSRALRKYLKRWRSMLDTAKSLADGKSRLEKTLREAHSADPSDYQSLQQQIERMKKLIASLPWPESQLATLPSQITQLQQAFAQLNTQISTLEKAQEKHIGRAQTKLDQLREALDQDHSKDADQALNKTRNRLKSLAPKQRQHFEQELRPLAARLNVVHDWQGFAIEPKKMELCASMKSLVGSEEKAETLAAKIKSLQDEWKQLGPLPRARDQELWKEFKTAADLAFQPCKAAFALQAELRRENFKKRMQLVAQLKEYEDKMAWPDSVNTHREEGEPGDEEPGDTEPGKAPDWRLVQKTLDTAREAFRNIKPVDQKGERKSQKSFRKICDRIYNHIKEEYGRNIALKEELVTRAQELSELEDLQQAIDRAKRIQRDWKDVGMTPVGVDRKLWKKFRAACDAVFARLDQQRSQHTAEIDACVKQAESLRDQARALLDSDDAQRLHLKKDLSGLKQQFREIELPRGVQQRLGKDFQNFESRARDIAVNIRARQEKAQWQYLLEKIKACALKSTDEDTATSLWAKEGELPKGIDTQALETFWQQGPSEGNEEPLRDACIALEIFGEIESPDGDKKARMNYQMKRLVEGMGSQQAQPEHALQTSINDFIALHPTTDWTERFCSVVEKTRS
jgi:exonuclease SbcC